jgi:hypothetical protein
MFFGICSSGGQMSRFVVEKGVGVILLQERSATIKIQLTFRNVHRCNNYIIIIIIAIIPYMA